MNMCDMYCKHDDEAIVQTLIAGKKKTSITIKQSTYVACTTKTMQPISVALLLGKQTKGNNK